jgi:hypothetical protein
MSEGARKWAKVLAGYLYIQAISLMLWGIYTIYNYGSGDKYDAGGLAGHVVVGDAYNYQIIALRGIGWISAGLVWAVIAAAMSVVTAINAAHAPEHKATDYRDVPTGNVPGELMR